jgi:hypothetical protein
VHWRDENENEDMSQKDFENGRKKREDEAERHFQ